MPGLLGPTNPVPGYDSTPVKITPPTPNDTSIQNIVDPNRVVRPDGRTEQQDAGNAALSNRYESNFMTFIQRLRNAPQLGELFLQVLQGKGLQVTSGLRSGFAAELAQFVDFLQMETGDEGKLLAFVQEQMTNGTRFSGPLFQILRNAYASSPTGMQQNDILQFLRKYSDFASTEHLEGKMLRTLANMIRALPSRWGERLLPVMEQLENRSAADTTEQAGANTEKNTQAAPDTGKAPADVLLREPNVKEPNVLDLLDESGTLTAEKKLSDGTVRQTRPGEQQVDPKLLHNNRQENLKLLREQVFPLISRYVGLTHDHGRARGLLSMLTLDVARYENGELEGLLLSMRQLAADRILPEKLAQASDKELMQVLKDTNFFRAQNDSFANTLARLTDKALKGEGGMERQEAFRNILSSILIHESVYMPLNHIMLPIEWNGRLMFSEMWVDPDADKNSSRQAGPPPLRMLIKMDVDGVGAFDLLVNARGTDVDLQLACPSSVADLSGNMSETMSAILKRNGLQPGSVQVSAMRRPVTVSEAFPRIFERMNGINVKI